MRRLFTLIIFIASACTHSYAQYNTPQNYNWYFGTNAAVSFSTGSPVVITTSQLNTLEGSASVSSPAGTLLFYTDGSTVWNRNNAIMSGGGNISMGYQTESTTQGALIVPVLSNPNQYYIFSIEEVEDYLAGDNSAPRIFITTVDMSLAGGLGAVSTATSLFIGTPVSEKMIAIPGNNCDMWLMLHGRDNKNFMAYHITSAGINMTPVVSTLGTFTGFFSYDIGVIKISPDRTKLACVNWNDGNATGTYATTLNGTELYDFDPNTGIVSNCQVLESVREGYGAEFSPDNTKLYTCEVDPTSSGTYGTTRISQYNVSLMPTSAIISSKYQVASNANEWETDLKTAVNNKIYYNTISALPPYYLSVINSPNVAGSGCGNAANVVTLSTGLRYCEEGLPNTFQTSGTGSSITGPTTVCVGSTITLSNATPGGTWTSGTTTVATIGSSSGVVTGISNGTTSITYTPPGGGCTAMLTVTVTTVGAISGTPLVCQGGAVTLSDATAGGTWSSSNTSVATIGSANGVVSGVSSGNSVIQYSIGGCFATYTVTVNPISPVTGTLSMCNGGTTTLSDAIPGGTWSSGTPAVATVGLATGIVYSVSGGTSVITYTNPSGCLAMTTVTVNPIGPVTGASSICVTGTATLSDAAAGGTWSSSNTTVATIGINNGVVTSVSVGTVTITYTMPTGCFATYTVSVVSVSPITGGPGVCVGSTVTLSNSATGGTWNSGAPSVATVGLSSGIVTGVTTGSAPITYTIGTCVSTTTIVVNPPPVAISGITNACAGATTTLSDATAGGTWSSGNLSVATVNAASGVVHGVSAGAATITYMLATGCYITVPVTINPLPDAIAGPASVCLGNTVTLNDTSPGGTWSSGNNAIATIGAGTGVVSAVAIGNDNITYTLPTGCLVTTTVSVGALPDTPVTAPLIYCQNDSPIPALTAVGSGLQWYVAATGGSPLGAAPVPPVGAAGTFVWYVSQSSNGCEGPRAALPVTVHPRAPKPFIASSPTACQYDTASYGYDGILFPGIIFAWTLPSNALLASGAPTDPGIVVKFDTSLGNNYMILTVGDGYAPCNVTDTVPAVINISSPSATFYVKPNVCVGDTVTVALTSTTAGVTDYLWNFGSTGVYVIEAANSNHGGPYNLIWSQPGVYFITLTAISSVNCPSKTVQDSVEVHPYPDARIAPVGLLDGRNEICIGDSVLLQPMVYNGEDLYHWSPEHFFNQSNKSSEYGIMQKPGYVMLTVTDPLGCTTTDSIYIDAQPCCVVNFPNAFTPNGDGDNDVFRPLTDGHHSIHVLRIENRYGQTVFESADERAAWDGTFNGVPQDLGVYFYYFRYDCEGHTYMKKGDVTLVR